MKTGMLLFVAFILKAQLPTGTIAGVVRDPSGAAVSSARIKVVSVTTNESRSETTSQTGDYSFSALIPGEYHVMVEAARFTRMDRAASVEPGATTTADFDLRLGDFKESITVEGTSPQIRFDSHTVGGAITAVEIQNLPMNGRNFLELAKLEPGVQPATRASGNRTMVPVLGAPGGSSGRGTRVTVDGGSIMSVGLFAAAMGFSQDVVQEFQVSTVNFDLASGLTFTGAINVATRSGGNDLHGSGFYFFRDHILAAYPALKRDPANPDPFFQRRQFGFALGGPIRRDRLFFFGNWERNEQRGVADTTLNGADFGHFSRITPTPLFGDQLSFRLDGRITERHTGFIRYSHDGNRAFGNSSLSAGTNAYPSDWTRQLSWADQSVLGVTSILRPTIVNDLRFSYFFISSSETPPKAQDCPGCLGLGAPSINVPGAGLYIGESTYSFNLGRRYHLNDLLAWQRGTHRARIGIDFEHNRGGLVSLNNEPVTMTLFSPDSIRAYNAKAAPDSRIPLPASF